MHTFQSFVKNVKVLIVEKNLDLPSHTIIDSTLIVFWPKICLSMPITSDYPYRWVKSLLMTRRTFTSMGSSSLSRLLLRKPNNESRSEIYPEHVTVWCALWFGGIIRLIFLEIEASDELRWMAAIINSFCISIVRGCSERFITSAGRCHLPYYPVYINGIGRVFSW